MRAFDAMAILKKWDKRGRYVFTKGDLAKLLNEPADSLNKTLERLVKAGVLVRASRGVFVFGYSEHLGVYILEEIAQTLRRYEYNYLSLESALSEWGAISQVPLNRITVMTTGRKGEFRTPYGVIEFVHTECRPETIIANTTSRNPHPLPIASVELALANQKRVRRNYFLLNENYKENQ